MSNKAVNLKKYIEEGNDIESVLNDLKWGNLVAQGLYHDDRIQHDIDMKTIAVNIHTKEYTPPPIIIQTSSWYTYDYDEQNNALTEMHEAGTMVGFSSFSNIEIITTKKKKHKKSAAPAPEWREAIIRLTSYIHHHKSLFELSDDEIPSARFIWNILKHSKGGKLDNKPVTISDVPNSKTLTIDNDTLNTIEDLTDCIQEIALSTVKNEDGKSTAYGHDVMYLRVEAKEKQTRKFETFENIINDINNGKIAITPLKDLNAMLALGAQE